MGTCLQHLIIGEGGTVIPMWGVGITILNQTNM